MGQVRFLSDFPDYDQNRLTMDPCPLLPAFQLLWDAAKSESRKYNANDCVNGNVGTGKQNKLVNGIDINSSKKSNDSFSRNETSCESSTERQSNDTVTCSDDSVVVCTLECDHGDKFVRQIIHDGKTRSEWSRAEDVFVDWLNSDLTSQHAQRIDVTIYFCRIPVSTSSDGICLWVKNLRDEGKEVNVKIKVASLGHSIMSRALDSIPNNSLQRKGTMQEIHDLSEIEDTMRAARRLAKLGAVIEPVSGGDWLQLISLLTDRASLQSLDLKRSPSADALSTILQSTL